MPLSLRFGARLLERGLLDTSVVIDPQRIPADALPARMAVSAVTMAELAAGPAATTDEAERARRQGRLQRAEATFDPLPLDIEAAGVRPHLRRRPSPRTQPTTAVCGPADCRGRAGQRATRRHAQR
jgi:predicted nucleic acid-binding protein